MEDAKRVDCAIDSEGIEARDQPSFNTVDINRFMGRINQEIVLTSSLHLGEGVGKFRDSNSESDVEDLGDAELPSGSSPAPPLSVPAVAAPPPPVQRPVPSPASPSAPPHWYKPPWKSVWKGPLPPARLSPVATLGDFLPSAWTAAAGQGAAGRVTGSRDPLSTHGPCLGDRGACGPGPTQQLVDPGLGIRSSPPHSRPEHPTHSTPALPTRPPPQVSASSGCRRRLVNATIPQHLLSPTPYRDALMARRGRVRRRGQEGRGGPAAQPARPCAGSRCPARPWGGCSTGQRRPHGARCVRAGRRVWSWPGPRCSQQQWWRGAKYRCCTGAAC
jgi:hypothetical protein